MHVKTKVRAVCRNMCKKIALALTLIQTEKPCRPPERTHVVAMSPAHEQDLHPGEVGSQESWNPVLFGEAVIQKLMKDHWISREVALKHIASFIKKYVPLEERDLIDDMVNNPTVLLKVMANIYIAKCDDNGEDP